MIIPDLNLLLYAYNTSALHHVAAAAWWERCLTGEEEVGLATVVAFGFVRIATHPRLFPLPLTLPEAVGAVQEWLEQPKVRVLQADGQHLHAALEFILHSGASGNLSTDAQLAALALQHNATLHTADSDFRDFSGVKFFEPLAAR